MASDRVSDKEAGALLPGLHRSVSICGLRGNDSRPELASAASSKHRLAEGVAAAA